MIERDIRIPLEVLLRPDQEPLPVIVNTWEAEGGCIHRIEIEHRSDCCEPASGCRGLVTTSFREDMKGDKQTVCRGCEKLVVVNITAAKLSMKPLFRRSRDQVGLSAGNVQELRSEEPAS